MHACHGRSLPVACTAPVLPAFLNALLLPEPTPSTTPLCRNVFYRERAAGMYTALPMAIAQGNVEIPYLLAQTIVYSCIVYW